MIRRLLRRKASSPEEVEVEDESVNQWLPAEPGPNKPIFPLPTPWTKPILKAVSGDEAALSPSQRKFLSKEWARLEAERSVSTFAHSIDEAVQAANRLWKSIELPQRARLPSGTLEIGLSGTLGRKEGGRIRRAVVFDPAIGVTKGEMLDQMLSAPRGLLCRAVVAYRSPQPHGLHFEVDDMVLALQPMPDLSGSIGMMDGVANGIRGAFPGTHVQKCPTQPMDVTFMWTNQFGRPAAAQSIAATHTIEVSPSDGGDDDEYEMFGGDNDAEANAAIDSEDEDTVIIPACASAPVRDEQDDGYVVMEAKELEIETSEVGIGLEPVVYSVGHAGAAETAADEPLPDLPQDSEDDDDDIMAAALMVEEVDAWDVTEGTTGGDAAPSVQPSGYVVDDGGRRTSASDESDNQPHRGRSRTRTPSWGRKPLASPPPLRRTRSANMGTPDIQPTQADLPASARGWVQRSLRRRHVRDAADHGLGTAAAQRIAEDPDIVVNLGPPTAESGTRAESHAPPVTAGTAATEPRPAQAPAAAAAAAAASSAPSSPATSAKTSKRKSSEREGHTSYYSRLKSTLTRSSRGNVSPYNSRRIDFLHRCFAALEEMGLDHEGIYRTAGQTSKVVNLYSTYVVKKHEAKFDECDVATLTSAVKHVFREAAEPVLTPYDTWIAITRTTPLDSDERRTRLKAAFDELPDDKRLAMDVLLGHLHRIVALSSVNKMAPRNIGVVFGPTLLRIGSEVSDIADIPLAAQVVAGLLEVTSTASVEGDAANGTSPYPPMAQVESTAAAPAAMDRAVARKAVSSAESRAEQTPATATVAVAAAAAADTAEPEETTAGFNPVFNMPRESRFIEFDGFGENDAYVDLVESSDTDEGDTLGEGPTRRESSESGDYIQLSFGDDESVSSASSPLPPLPKESAGIIRTRRGSVYGFGTVALESDSDDDLC